MSPVSSSFFIELFDPFAVIVPDTPEVSEAAVGVIAVWLRTEGTGSFRATHIVPKRHADSFDRKFYRIPQWEGEVLSTVDPL